VVPESGSTTVGAYDTRQPQTMTTDTGAIEMTGDTRQRTNHPPSPRFSEGIEQLPDTPEKRVTGGFGRGIERRPGTPEKAVTRRFSHGIEQLPDTPEKRALGRFSRGIEHHSRRAR
jgi:hypothetical protein